MQQFGWPLRIRIRVAGAVKTPDMMKTMIDREIEHLSRVMPAFLNEPSCAIWLDRTYWQKRIEKLLAVKGLTASQRSQLCRLLAIAVCRGTRVAAGVSGESSSDRAQAVIRALFLEGGTEPEK